PRAPLTSPTRRSSGLCGRGGMRRAEPERPADHGARGWEKIRARISSAGQKRVKADWIRFTPTKAGSSSHHGLTGQVRTTPVRTKDRKSTRLNSSHVKI